jgi:glycosyltransferase involved in cell wall biosynthesis
MPDRRPRIVYWNHSPTPYFVDRFNAVVERGTLDFEAWFNDRREPMRSWDVEEADWNFPARYIPHRRLLGWSTQIPAAELRLARPDLFVQEYDRAHLMAGFAVGASLAGRTAFRVLPNFDSWSDRTWWREGAKQFAFRAVDGAKVPGPDGADLANRYGLDGDRIYSVTQSVALDSLRPPGDDSSSKRSARRAELGLDGCVFVYSGRLWSGKGTDDLFDAYERLLAQGRAVSLLLLGDGPDEARYRARAESMSGVVFAGFVQAAEIGEYYGLADVMVFPTLGDPHGLVVEEAMAAELPVISSSAAGDIAIRLPEAEAGFVVEPQDPDALCERMRVLADDVSLRTQMGLKASQLVSARGHARYARDFESFVFEVLSAPRRSGVAAASARLAGRSLSALCWRQQTAAQVGSRAGVPTPEMPTSR